MRRRFIVDRWVWELPGGYVDDGEDSRAAAAREVEEGEPDADETAEVRWVPLKETPEMIARGDNLGAITIIGVQHALLQRST